MRNMHDIAQFSQKVQPHHAYKQNRPTEQPQLHSPTQSGGPAIPQFSSCPFSLTPHVILSNVGEKPLR